MVLAGSSTFLCKPMEYLPSIPECVKVAAIPVVSMVACDLLSQTIFHKGLQSQPLQSLGPIISWKEPLSLGIIAGTAAYFGAFNVTDFIQSGKKCFYITTALSGLVASSSALSTYNSKLAQEFVENLFDLPKKTLQPKTKNILYCLGQLLAFESYCIPCSCIWALYKQIKIQ